MYYMNDEQIKLYVVAHKDFDGLPEGRTVIGVGENRALSVADVYDDCGDNIAQKNGSFCELTALYWIWKNSDADIAGLEHYRRFFLCAKKPVCVEKVKKILSICDVIVPVKLYYKRSAYEQFAREHPIGDLDETGRIIEELCPSYKPDFDKLKKVKWLYTCNMIIAPKAVLDDYCAWLFPILFELEKRIDLAGRDDYQKRAVGFIAERLINVYLWHNSNLKIKRLKITPAGGMKYHSYPVAKLVYFIKTLLKMDC